MAKKLTTSSEMAAIIMEELRHSPDCAMLAEVTVRPMKGSSPQDWEIRGLTHVGATNVSRDCWERVEQVKNRLRLHFILEEN